MARTARITFHFVESTPRVDDLADLRDYVVEVRQGQVRWTIGRVSGSPRWGAWNGLPIGADAWTRWHCTRAAALRALWARENFQHPETFIAI